MFSTKVLSTNLTCKSIVWDFEALSWRLRIDNPMSHITSNHCATTLQHNVFYLYKCVKKMQRSLFCRNSNISPDDELPRRQYYCAYHQTLALHMATHNYTCAHTFFLIEISYRSAACVHHPKCKLLLLSHNTLQHTASAASKKVIDTL